MAEGIRVEEDIGDFIKKLMKSVESINSVDGEILVEEGELIDTGVPIDETRFSDSKTEAMDEYEYIKTRKTGEKISSEDKEKIKRIERDILKNKSKGFIYGNGRNSR